MPDDVTLTEGYPPPLLVKTLNRQILIIQFSDYSGRWAVHIPLEYNSDEVESWKSFIIAPLQHLGDSIPHFCGPKLHHYSLSHENPIGIPYIILDWIEGKPLGPFTNDIPLSARMGLLDDLGDVLLDMMSCSLENAKDIIYYGIQIGIFIVAET